MATTLLLLAGSFLATLSNSAPTASSLFTYYNLTTPEAGPCDLTTGPDGAIWVDTFLANRIVRLDQSTGQLDEYDIPYTLGPLPSSALPSDLQGRVALACVIQPGNDGKLYAASGVRNQIVRIDPTTKAIDVFTPTPLDPLGNLEPFNDMWRGNEGMYFSQTTGNVITLFNYATEEFTNYPIHTPLAGPLGMIVGSDGALWFTEFLANKIGRLNQSTGSITEYDLPISALGPAVMRAETEGRYLWFTCLEGNAIGRIDEQTGESQIFTNPSHLSAPTEDTVDADGNIWFSTLTQNTLNYLTPSTGEFITIAQPDGTIVTSPVSVPPAADIAMHYESSDNAMYFTELANNRIGRYQLS